MQSELANSGVLGRHADLRDIDGTRLRFIPHDFRRVFATESVIAGPPIHIHAKLLGHLDLNTTQGYLAVYTDVVRPYRDFIPNRHQIATADHALATGASTPFTGSRGPAVHNPGHGNGCPASRSLTVHLRRRRGPATHQQRPCR